MAGTLISKGFFEEKCPVPFPPMDLLKKRRGRGKKSVDKQVKVIWQILPFSPLEGGEWLPPHKYCHVFKVMRMLCIFRLPNSVLLDCQTHR